MDIALILSLFTSIFFIFYAAAFAQLCIFFKRNGDPWWFGLLPIIGGVATIIATMILPSLLALLAWFALFLVFGVMPGWRFCQIIGVNFFATVALGFLGVLALAEFVENYSLWRLLNEHAKLACFGGFIVLVFLRMNWVMWKFLSHLQAPMVFRISLYVSYYCLILLGVLFTKGDQTLLGILNISVFTLAFVYISWLMCFHPGEALKRPEIPADKKVLGPYFGSILSAMLFPPLAVIASVLAFIGLRRSDLPGVDRKYLRAATVIGATVGVGFTTIYLIFSTAMGNKAKIAQDAQLALKLKNANSRFVALHAKSPNKPISIDSIATEVDMVMSPDVTGRGLNQLNLQEAVYGLQKGRDLHYVQLDGVYRTEPIDGDVAEQLHQINKSLKR